MTRMEGTVAGRQRAPKITLLSSCFMHQEPFLIFPQSRKNCNQGFPLALDNMGAIFSLGAFTSQLSQWMGFLGHPELALPSRQASVIPSLQAAQMHPLHSPG